MNETKKESIEKMCPIMSPGEADIPCQKEKCAWWIPVEDGHCVIVEVARVLLRHFK